MKDLPSIIQKIDERGYYDKFARTLIKHLQSNIDLTDIRGWGNDVKLRGSFQYRLFFDANRRIERITLEHKFAGLFVDLGVGRGVKLEDIGYQKIGRTLLGRKVKHRRAKRWYLKTIYGQTLRLMAIVTQQRGDEFTVMVTDAFEKVGKINLAA